jgi:thioredoxin-related protein
MSFSCFKECAVEYLITPTTTHINNITIKHSSIVRKQEKDIKLSTIDNEKFTMEKYYTDSKPLLIIYFHPECYFCSMEMSEMLEIKRIENFNALFITNALESEVQDFLLQYPIDKLKNATIAIDIHGEFAERFKIKAPPTIIIYDKKGKLKKIFRGAVTIKKIVKYLY